MSTKRVVQESPITQGADERIAYVLTTTPWGSDPVNPEVSIYEQKTRRDCSTTCLASGIPSIAGDLITSPLVYGLTPGKVYQLEFKFDITGNTLETFCIINAEY